MLSTTINRYVYVVASVTGDGNLQITSSDCRTFYRHTRGEPLLWDGDLSLPRAVLHRFGIEQGLSLFMASEVPPGTGLGSSSGVTVALVKALAWEGRRCLLANDLDRFGALLVEAWQHKRCFAPGVSNPEIEVCYDLARRHGALGGKIAGAGGGFLILYCPDSHAPRVRTALEAEGLRCMDFRFEEDGARVLLDAGLRLRTDRVMSELAPVAHVA